MKFIFNTSFVILSFNLDFLLYKNGTSHWYNRDRIEGRPLKLVYNDPPNLSNDELLEKVKSKWNYFWHKSDSFRFVQKSCNFRNKCILHGKKTNREREYHGCETVSSLTPKNWELIPNSLKEEMLLAVFKNTFKNFDNFPMLLPTL